MGSGDTPSLASVSPFAGNPRALRCRASKSSGASFPFSLSCRGASRRGARSTTVPPGRGRSASSLARASMSASWAFIRAAVATCSGVSGPVGTTAFRFRFLFLNFSSCASFSNAWSNYDSHM